MFEGFAHNHQVMVFGCQALKVLTASGSLRDGMWHYRGRLRTFHAALHDHFEDHCLWHLTEQSRGPVPQHEIRALRISVDRREPCEARKLILEQALLRPKVRCFGRSYCDDHLQEEAGLDRMTSDPVELTWEQLDGEEEAGEHVCSECSQRFSRAGDLERHISAVHLQERPHACTECGQCFSQAGNLERHVRDVHRGEKPYVCPECSQQFSQAGHLEQHIRAVHRGEKPYVCPDCSQRFSEAGHLERHVRDVHRGEKPYVCPDCSQRFSQASDVERHMRAVHLGQKPHACEHCHARFAQAWSLKIHIERMHTERGQQRQKKREETVARFLTQSSYSFEREARVEFCSARDAPCPGESRPVNTSLARLDFVLYRPWGVCVVEVDEKQHDHMPQACETARMLNVLTQHVQRSPGVPLRFVRYNPDAFKIAAAPAKATQALRHSKLLLALEERPTKDFEIWYLFYDVARPDGHPLVCEEPDYPEELKEAVRCFVW
ncbi:Znf771 [Symbiodinium sp. KB8]|nr:Znf771 [Symbiodinium sp. KB8]